MAMITAYLRLKEAVHEKIIYSIRHTRCYNRVNDAFCTYRIVLGIGTIINGLYNLKTVRILVTDTDYQRLISIRGFTSIAIGVLAVLLPLLIAGIVWTVMIYILAVYLLLSAGTELFALSKIKEAGIETKPYMYEVFFSIGFALLLFIMPAKFGLIIVRILGILILLAAAGFIFREWKNKPLIVYPEQKNLQY